MSGAITFEWRSITGTAFTEAGARQRWKIFEAKSTLMASRGLRMVISEYDRGYSSGCG